MRLRRKARAHLQMKIGFGDGPHQGHRIHLLRRRAGQFQARGDGMLGHLPWPPQGVRRRTSLDSSTAATSSPSFRMARGGIAEDAADSEDDHLRLSRFSILAQVSRSAAVRLNTGLPGRGIRVHAEIAQALELVAALRRGAPRSDGSSLQPVTHFERFGIQVGGEILALGHLVGIFVGEQVVVEPHFGIDGVCGRDPVDGGFHPAAIGRVAAARGRVIGAVHFHHFAVLVLHHAGAGDEIGVAQAHFAAGREAEILLGRIFAEIVLLDVEDFGKRHLARAGGGVFGIVDGLHLLDLALGIVVDHHAQRPQHGHHARRALVQVFAHVVFQQPEFDDAVGFRYADGAAEVADALPACSRGGGCRTAWACADRPSRARGRPAPV